MSQHDKNAAPPNVTSVDFAHEVRFGTTASKQWRHDDPVKGYGHTAATTPQGIRLTPSDARLPIRVVPWAHVLSYTVAQ